MHHRSRRWLHREVAPGGKPNGILDGTVSIFTIDRALGSKSNTQKPKEIKARQGPREELVSISEFEYHRFRLPIRNSVEVYVPREERRSASRQARDFRYNRDRRY